MNDVMSLREFQEELRRNARFEARAPLEDALAAAVQSIKDNPAFAQSRLLGKVMRALAQENGEFRRAEASVFDTPTLRLVIALIDAAGARTHTHAEWLAAVAAADSNNA